MSRSLFVLFRKTVAFVLLLVIVSIMLYGISWCYIVIHHIMFINQVKCAIIFLGTGGLLFSLSEAIKPIDGR